MRPERTNGNSYSLQHGRQKHCRIILCDSIVAQGVKRRKPTPANCFGWAAAGVPSRRPVSWFSSQVDADVQITASVAHNECEQSLQFFQ